MVEHQGGLRFDIYERVHLSEGVAGIKELEDVELVPHIQVLPQGEQALLRGNLLLSGTYVDEQDASNRTLEHLIPVEITLPMNRIQRVEDISVEIENFDVDLLSTRSLNITGVLSLNGLEVISASSGERWGEAEEEVVFVHEAQLQPHQDGDSGTNGRLAADNRQEQAQTDWSSSALAYAAANPPESVENAYTQQVQRNEFPAAVEETKFGNPNGTYVQEAEEAQSNPEGPFAAVETAQFNNDGYDSASSQEEKKEVKVAFSGKKTEDEKPSSASNGLASLLQGASTGKFDARSQENQESAAQAVSSNEGERLEWKKLLLSSKSERQEFRRVRLCIVQKEETLDSIAKRYELNPREIAIFNRLGENNLTEGQIVYIPK